MTLKSNTKKQQKNKTKKKQTKKQSVTHATVKSEVYIDKTFNELVCTRGFSDIKA